MECPAKVFTAANHPYFVNHLLWLPSPTEQFVRNFGPRLHHLAVALPPDEIADLNIPTGIPLVYEFNPVFLVMTRDYLEDRSPQLAVVRVAAN